MKELTALRNELAVGKSRYNSFGEFYYRSQEDILEAIKPLLAKHKLFITISDEMIMLGDRYYVKATVVVRNEGGSFITTSVGYAREPENKKKMDASQVTGTASSYARKHALNAMFLIDDTKDADTDEFHKQAEKTKEEKPKPNKSNNMKAIIEFVSASNMTEEEKIVARRAVADCRGDELSLGMVLKNLKIAYGDEK